MTTMRIIPINLAFALALGLGTIATAQPDDRRPPRFDIEHMTEKLDLSEAQAAQIQTIHDKQRAAVAELAKNLPEGQRPDRAAVREVIAASRQEMRAVLTPEQIEKLEASRTQRGETGRRGKHPQMHKELRAYRQQTIVPELVTLRSEFDKQLSARERADVEALRTLLREEFGEGGLRKMSDVTGGQRGHHAHGDRVRPSGKTQPGPQADDKRPNLRAFVQAHPEEFGAVRAIAKRHSEPLEEVRKQLKESQQRWREESNAIRARHLSQEEMQQLEERQNKRGRMHHEHDDQHPTRQHPKRAGGDQKHDRGAMMFLLMDVNQLADEELELDEGTGLKVFPNPAGASATLSYEVKKTGPVLVELLNTNGVVIETVLDKPQEAGTYELLLDLPSDLKGKAVVRVKDASGVRSATLLRN